MAENCIRFKVHSTNCNTRRTHGRRHHIFINAPRTWPRGGMCGHLLVRNCGDSVIARRRICIIIVPVRIPVLRFLPRSRGADSSASHRSRTDIRRLRLRFFGANANHFPGPITLNANYLRGSRGICTISPRKFLRLFQRGHESLPEKKLEITRDSPGRG